MYIYIYMYKYTYLYTNTNALGLAQLASSFASPPRRACALILAEAARGQRLRLPCLPQARAGAA